MKAIIPIFSLFFITTAQAAAPAIPLAKEYQGQNIQGWAMSEKLDGVRAYWNGKQLISRQGHPFTPPAGFTRNFPPYPLDGELYSQRGQFEQISAAVRTTSSNWAGIKLHVFDVPHAHGNLYQRLSVIQRHLKSHPANIVVIKQIPVQNSAQAEAFMRKIVANGGEGAIVRNPEAPYTSGRSNSYLKLKPQQDAECTVVAHHQGKGKYVNQLGAISCQNAHGTFRIGSGFKDHDRAHPPAIGTLITYRHRGFTSKGLPRFATYLRVRSDQ